MDDPNITMEEYIRLEEEKARRRAMVFNDTLTSEAALSCEPTLNSLNNDEINFRISFDESDDEDCMPTISYDLDFFKDFENEFPAIVYNDAQTSKSDFLTEPTLNKDNDDDKVDIEHSSGDLSVKPLPDLINSNVGAYAHGSDKLLETRPRERNIDEYWWRIYKSGNLEVLES
ncbi:hypothetical protein Tco_1001749 [Tanacetum coccineum]